MSATTPVNRNKGYRSISSFPFLAPVHADLWTRSG
jgi:hypothetical protein